MSNSRKEALQLENNIRSTKKTAEITNLFSSIGFSLFYVNNFAIVSLAKDIINFVVFTGLNIFFFLPAFVVTSGLQAALAFREAKLRKWNTHPTIRFIIELGSSVLISASVAGTFFTHLALWELLPFLFTAVMGIKGLYQFGSGVYSAVKAILYRNAGVERKKHFVKAGEYFVNSLSSMCMGAGTMLLYISLLSAAPVLGIIGGAFGVIGGLVAAGIGMNKLRRMNKKKKIAEFETMFVRAREMAQAGSALGSRAIMTKRLGVGEVRKVVNKDEVGSCMEIIDKEKEMRDGEEKFLELEDRFVGFRLK